MMKRKSKPRPPITAGELMDQLEVEAKHQAATAERDRLRKEKIAELSRNLEPVEADLRNIGYDLRLLQALKSSGKKYQLAIPVLLEHIQRNSHSDVKMILLRLLSVRWVKGNAAEVLLKEFERLPAEDGSRWYFGDALTFLATPSVLENLIAIVTNPANGKAREMFVLALARIRDPRSIETVITLLDDEQVAGHAIVALRKLKATEALDHLARFGDHPKTWVRNEAKKAISALLKVQSRPTQ